MTSDTDTLQDQPPLIRLIHGHYGLAVTYWLLFLLAAAAFFVTASMAVAVRDWPRFLILLVLSVGWTFLLLAGIRRAYKGSDPGKAIARISMLFLTLNLTNTLAALSFI